MGIVKQYAIVISDLILKELALVLSRPKFKTSQDEVQRVIVALMRTAEVVNVTSKLKAVKEDPKDDMIVDTAYDGNANMIVTGDSHLLALNEYREIKIVTVEKMIAYLISIMHNYNNGFGSFTED